MSSRRRLTWTSLAVLALVGLLGCGERVPRFPADRFPADAWRGEAVPLPLGRVEQDTLDVAAGDHTDWRSLHAGRTGQLVLSLRLYRDQQAPRQGGHLQILNPHKVNVLALELLPEQEAYEVEIPVLRPGVWLVGLSLRGGRLVYEMKARWR